MIIFPASARTIFARPSLALVSLAIILAELLKGKGGTANAAERRLGVNVLEGRPPGASTAGVAQPHTEFGGTLTLDFFCLAPAAATGYPGVDGSTFGVRNATQVGRMHFVSMGIAHSAGTDYETCC